MGDMENMGCMKFKILGALLIVALLFGLAGLASGPVESQDRWSQQVASTLVNSKGILFFDAKNYNTFFDDFNFFNASLWDTTSVVDSRGSAFAVVDSATGGLLKISIGAFKNDAANVQSINAPFKLGFSPGRPDSSTVETVFEARFMVSEKTQSVIVAGLCAEDEDLAGAVQDGIYFWKPDQTDSLYVSAEKAGTGVFKYAGVAVANRTMVRLKIEWNGSRARFYVNDVYKTYISTTANIPVVNLKPSFEVACGDSVAHFAYLDYILARQKR